MNIGKAFASASAAKLVDTEGLSERVLRPRLRPPPKISALRAEA